MNTFQVRLVLSSIKLRPQGLKVPQTPTPSLYGWNSSNYQTKATMIKARLGVLTKAGAAPRSVEFRRLHGVEEYSADVIRHRLLHPLPADFLAPL